MRSFLPILGSSFSSEKIQSFLIEYSLENDGDDPIGDEVYFLSPRKGIEVTFGLHTERLCTIFLYDGSDGDYLPFCDVVEYGLSFDWTRSDVVARFGEASIQQTKPVEGPTRPFAGWDRFDYDDHSIHFSYTPLIGTVNLITLMTPDRLPQSES